MVDLPPQQEIVDSKGSSIPYVGTVGITAISLPSSAGSRINSMFIRCPNQTPTTRRLSYSIDSGVTFLVLSPGESIMWPLKGSIPQVDIKGNVANVSYEIILNFDQLGEI